MKNGKSQSEKDYCFIDIVATISEVTEQEYGM